MGKDRKGADFMVKFCPIHLSTFDSSKDTHCLWDKTTGPRPGRGMCENHSSTVSLGYGVRVHELQEEESDGTSN